MESKFELNEEELELVNGGVNSKGSMVTRMCPNCNKQVSFRVESGGRAFCTVCNTQILL